jgi:hypothetical protein
MIDLKTIMEQLTGQTQIDLLTQFLEKHCEGFPEIREKFQEAIVQTEKGDKLADAIAAQVASDLLFSAALGLKANLDHFLDPVARTFLEVDPEIYLRESVAHNMPQYIEAQKILDTIKVNDAIIEYTTYLESVGPKLAHCFGYLLGDELFPRIIPGYQPDPPLTIRYHNWVCAYMGIE